MAGHSIGIGNPHSGTEHTREVERTETEATKSSQQQVNAKDLGQIEGGFTSTGVLPDLKIPVGPVPDGSQHHQTGEDDVSSSHTLEAPEAGVDTGFTGDAPTTPAAGHAQAGHEGHHEHPLAPHGVEDGVGGVKDGELIQSHRTGPAGDQSGVHQVHSQ